MIIKKIEHISECPAIRKEVYFQDIYNDVLQSIKSVDWPHGSGAFSIHPGKHLNGVLPIKLPCIQYLVNKGWIAEALPPINTNYLHTGDFDAIINKYNKYFALEWETGNISSSHRAVNKIALSLLQGNLSGAFLILPAKELAVHLTDRIGNFEELEPYFPLFSRYCGNMPFDIISITYDSVSEQAPIIPKGKDGLAKKS